MEKTSLNKGQINAPLSGSSSPKPWTDTEITACFSQREHSWAELLLALYLNKHLNLLTRNPCSLVCSDKHGEVLALPVVNGEDLFSGSQLSYTREIQMLLKAEQKKLRQKKTNLCQYQSTSVTGQPHLPTWTSHWAGQCLNKESAEGQLHPSPPTS